MSHDTHSIHLVWERSEPKSVEVHAMAERLQGKWDAEGEAYDRLWPDKKAYEAELARIDEQFEDINTAPDLARMQENG